MPRCEFDTPQVVSEDASAVLAKLAPRLKHIAIGAGLHGVSALDPKDAFIVALVNDYGVTSEEELLYIDPEFVEAQYYSRPLILILTNECAVAIQFIMRPGAGETRKATEGRPLSVSKAISFTMSAAHGLVNSSHSIAHTSKMPSLWPTS